MFMPTNFALQYAPHPRVQALETWREAASLVRIRWQAFLEAEASSASRAFASYVAALDAEEAAAAEMAALSPSTIAA
jgi:hypothetical protein